MVFEKVDEPQVLARVLRNVSSNVTVVGDVAKGGKGGKKK